MWRWLLREFSGRAGGVMRSHAEREAEGQRPRDFNCNCRRTVGSQSADLGFGNALAFLGKNIDKAI